ncbi:hypothetical protein BJV82DRAFT_588017 [Fennellomyces sp. T-0311]|nr:hypothetical protein BJV82DRAFT_588017 [Fennellomyces sp. T-0311]
MEFDEVNHFVKHVKSSTLDDRSIAALEIGTPYYPDFPYPQTIAIKKRPITAKFVDTVRHRLKKSSSVSTSDTEDSGKTTSRKRLILSRLKKQQHTEEDGYFSLDDAVYRNKRRPTIWKRRRRRSSMDHRPVPPDPIKPDQKLADLQVINYQMRSFCVPSDWASVARPMSVSPPPIIEPIGRRSPITLASVLDDMTEDINRYQYLCNQEQQRIETSRQEIQDYVAKLQQLDQDVEQLNAKIALARSEGMKRMQQTLYNTQRRLPLLKDSRLRHKRIVVAIEGYNKSMNYAVRLADLQRKVMTARQRQLTWSCVQSWIPPIGKRDSAIVWGRPC